MYSAIINPQLLINMLGSAVVGLNPIFIRKLVIFQCHKFVDWCKPYKDFLNSRTIPSVTSGSKSWSPSGISMQFGLSRSKPVNALDASSI